MVVEGGVDVEELGRATWTFLHTLAATHSAAPSPAEVKRIERFMRDFSEIYPCAPCAESFRGIMKRVPVDASTGPKFAQWMCKVHNEVNKEIGKPLFNCEEVSKSWGVCESCARHEDSLIGFKGLLKRMRQAGRKDSTANKERSSN